MKTAPIGINEFFDFTRTHHRKGVDMHERSTQHSATLTGLAALCLLAPGFSPSAAASDSKYHNGAFCRVAFSSGAPNMATFVDYNTNGSVANQSTQSAMTLVCPILRDNTTNTDGWNKVEVGYFDKNGLDIISCTVLSQKFDGSAKCEEAGVSTDSVGTQWRKTGMVFQSGLEESTFDGVYFVRCILPPRLPSQPPSGIAWYRIEEP